MTHVIRLAHYEFPIIFDIDLPKGQWFLVRFEPTPDVLIAHTNRGDYIIGDYDAAGRLYMRHEAERIPE